MFIFLGRAHYYYYILLYIYIHTSMCVYIYTLYYIDILGIYIDTNMMTWAPKKQTCSARNSGRVCERDLCHLARRPAEQLE
jgi:hypothetical protein